MTIKVGLFGTNGHQIQYAIESYENLDLVAVAGIQAEHVPEFYRESVQYYDTFDALLEDSSIDLVSLCSPYRSEQANHAIKALKAGKHVYAEKPCALNETDLDAIIDTARSTGKIFHEMAGTTFVQPYKKMKEIVGSGILGDIVQVYAQKSYPLLENRPQDEAIDGGLIMQNGVHATRFVEQISGQRIQDITAIETNFTNPGEGDLQIAATMMMRLGNGGIATIIANYLNPPNFGTWGNEHVRIFGTTGLLESTDGGTRTRLITHEKDFGEIDCSGESDDFFQFFLDEILLDDTFPISLEDELHPTRMVIQAKQKSTVSPSSQ
ncbi:MAG: Gfo/Idh/MocA family oxidoreductase [Lentisphaeria bacterium]|nr:Gfo/Idh/MocA family oxidoreductase [Lentisphaeria bacterium]